MSESVSVLDDPTVHPNRHVFDSIRWEQVEINPPDSPRVRPAPILTDEASLIEGVPDRNERGMYIAMRELGKLPVLGLLQTVTFAMWNRPVAKRAAKS